MPELTARLRLIADIRDFAGNLQRGAGQARSALGTLDKQVGRVGKGLNGANKASKGFFQTLKANVGTQIKAGLMFATLYQALILFRQVIGGAITELFNLDEALRKVQSISKDSDEAIKALNDQLIKAAREGKLFGQTASEVAVGMFEIVQAGFDTAEAFEIATVAAQAATAGFTDAATAGKVITGSLLAFGDEAGTAREVADVLFQTIDTGVVTFEELAQGLGVAMAPAAQLEVTLEELGSAVALMTRKGIPANRAMTSLTRILFQFLDPSDKAAKAAEEIGFSLSANTIKTHGLVGAMHLLNKRAGGNEEVLAKVFDRQRALIGAYSLLSDGGTEWAAILKVVNGATADSGALQKAFDERSKALTFRLKLLRSQLLSVVTQGFQPWATGLGIVVDLLSRLIADEWGIFQWLKDTAVGVTGLSDAWNDFAQALKAVFAQSDDPRLPLMFHGLFVILREGIPPLFSVLELLLRIGTWALENKPALIAIAVAFGALFIAAHPLLATLQALLLVLGYTEQHWHDWRVKVVGTTAVVLLAVIALNMLWSAFTASRLAMTLFNTNLKGVTAGTNLLVRALMNMAAGVKEAFGPMIQSFKNLGGAAKIAGDRVWGVANGLADILAKPANIVRTVTVKTIETARKGVGIAAGVAAEAGKAGAEATKKGIITGLVKGLAQGIGAAVGGAILAGLAVVATMISAPVALVVAAIALVIVLALVEAFLIWKYRKEIWAGLKTLGSVLKTFFTEQVPEFMSRALLDPMKKFFTEILPAWAKKQFTPENMGRWFGRILMGAILVALGPAVLIYKFREQLNEFGGKVIEFLVEMGGKIASGIEDALRAIFVALPPKIAGWLDPRDVAKTILGKLVDVAQWYIEFQKKILEFEKSIITFVAKMPGRIAEFIGDHWKDVLDWLVDVAQWYIEFERKLGEFILDTAQIMIDLAGDIGEWIGDNWKDIIGFLIDPEEWWTEFKGLVETFVDLVTEKVAPLLSGIGTAISGGIQSALSTAFSAVGSALESALRASLQWLLKIGGPIISFLGKFGKAIPEGMQDVIDWLEGGEKYPTAVGMAEGYAQGVRGFMGGLALVGERGAELVRLPRGADVFRHEDMGQALRDARGGGLSVSAEVNITTSLLRDYQELRRRVLRDVEEKLDDAAAAAGLTKPRFGTWGAGTPRI